MPCTKLHSRLSSKAPEPPPSASDDVMHNESWLFRILSRATAFGEILPRRPSPDGYSPTIEIVNMLSRDLAGVAPPKPSPKDDKWPQVPHFPGGCSIQRWLAFRASTASSEQNVGMSLAGPLEKQRERHTPPPPPPLSDHISTSLDHPSTSASAATIAKSSVIEDIPQLTFQEKLSLIIKEFGSLAKEDEEEQLLAESDASFFQDVAILGVIHLTTHRLTFHASLLNTRPDLASSKEILRSGYVDIRCGVLKKRHRVWMELTHDMITTYRSSAEEERVRPLRTLLLSSVRKVHPSDPSHPLQVKIDSISLSSGKSVRKNRSRSFFHRIRRLSHQRADISSTESIHKTELPEIITHVIESRTVEAAVSWRTELLAALYLFSKRRSSLLGNAGQPDTNDTSEDELESEHGVRISIPLERIKAHRMYQWDFAAVLQVDISMLTGTITTPDNIPSGSPLLPKVQLPESGPAPAEFYPNPKSEASTDEAEGQYIPDDTRFQFGLATAGGPWLQFDKLVDTARKKRAAVSSATNDSPVTVDFGTLTFIEEQVPLFDSKDSSDRHAIAINSREREVRRLFGLPDELEIWIVKCCRYRRTMRTTGLLVVSSKFICFWSRLVGTSDIRMRYHTEDLRSALASRSPRSGFGLTLRLAGHTDLVLDFTESNVRDEVLQRLEVFLLQNSTIPPPRRRMSSIRNDSTRDSPFFLTSSPEASEHSSIATRSSLPKSTAQVLSPISRTVSQLRSRTFPPALLPHLVKPINVPANIPYGISPRHFVLLTIGSRGDVQPYIALGKGLLSLGHRVTLVTHEEYKPWIEGFGIGHRPIAGDPGALMKLNVDHKMFSPGFFRESLTNFRGWIDDLLVLAWEHCKDADVLIESPSAMAGVHIAEALKIPYFRAFTMPWSRTTQFPHPFISPPVANNAKFNIASYSLFDNVFWLGTSSQINRWRKKQLGLSATDMGHLAQEKIPFLYNFSPSVVPKPSEWGDQITITGYWFLDNPDLNWTPSQALMDFIEKAHADNKPLVYIGFGSITVPSPSETTRNIVKAVLKSDVRAILSKGWSSRMHKETDEVEIPPQIFLIDKAPHDWLFAQMTAVVHHGGAGTTGASLRAGVPTIIKPWFGDQFFWASRVQRLGVGLKLSSVNSGELAEALKKATTDVKMREKAVLLGERISAEDGVTTAIRSIYTYLHRAGKDRTTL